MLTDKLCWITLQKSVQIRLISVIRVLLLYYGTMYD